MSIMYGNNVKVDDGLFSRYLRRSVHGTQSDGYPRFTLLNFFPILMQYTFLVFLWPKRRG